MTRTSGIIAFLLIVTAIAATAGDTYLPLEVGNRWGYSSDLEYIGPDIKECSAGPNELLGGAYAIRYLVSDHSPDLENYWSTNGEGDVLLHGFRRLDPRRAFYYDPPLVLVDAPLYEGKTWTSDVGVRTTPTGPEVGRLVVTYTVTEPDTLIAGGEPRMAWGVLEDQQVVASAIGESLMPDGRSLPVDKADPVVPHWWSLNVGEIQYRSAGTFHLVDFSVQAVPAERRSMSGLKGMFR